MKRPKLNKRFDAQHVRLYGYMLKSPAWLSLKSQARAVYIEISGVYDGFNNGRLGMSARTLAKRCRISKDTALVALSQLKDRGFIECEQLGAFSRKDPHASEFRLTAWPCNVTGALATKAFMNWGKENQKPVPKYHATVPNEGQEHMNKAA